MVNVDVTRFENLDDSDDDGSKQELVATFADHRSQHHPNKDDEAASNSRTSNSSNRSVDFIHENGDTIIVFYTLPWRRSPQVVGALCDSILPHKQLAQYCTICVERVSSFPTEQAETDFYVGLEVLGFALGQLKALRSIEFYSKDPYVIDYVSELLDLRAAGCVLQYTQQITQLIPNICRGDGLDLVFFSKKITDHPSLEKLWLGNIDVPGQYSWAIQNAVLSLPHLREFQYTAPADWPFFFNPGLLTNLIVKPTMRKLCVCGSTLWSGHVSVLHHALDQNRRSQLTTLVLDKCLLPVNFPAIPLRDPRRRRSRSSLACLELTMPEDETIYEQSHVWAHFLLGISLTANLKTLVIRNCVWTSTLCNALHEVMKNGLVSLTVEGFQSVDDWLALVSCLQVKNTLESLSLEDSVYPEKTGPEGDVILAHLGQAIVRFCPCLRFLEIRPFHCTCRISTIIQFIADLNYLYASKLKILKMDFRLIDVDIQAEYFVNVLWNNYFLCYVSLHDQDSDFIGFDHDHLQRDFFDSVHLRDYRELLEGLFEMNHAGRRYLLSDPSDKNQGFYVLNSVRDDLDSLFLHLRENPNLCSGWETVIVKVEKQKPWWKLLACCRAQDDLPMGKKGQVGASPKAGDGTTATVSTIDESIIRRPVRDEYKVNFDIIGLATMSDLTG